MKQCRILILEPTMLKFASGKTELSAEELKELEEEKKHLQEELEAKRTEYEARAKEIVGLKWKENRVQTVKHKMVEAELPHLKSFEHFLPAEEAKVAEGEEGGEAAQQLKKRKNRFLRNFVILFLCIISISKRNINRIDGV